MRNLTSQIGPPLRGFGVHRKNFSKKVSEVASRTYNPYLTFGDLIKNGLTYMFFRGCWTDRRVLASPAGRRIIYYFLGLYKGLDGGSDLIKGTLTRCSAWAADFSFSEKWA